MDKKKVLIIIAIIIIIGLLVFLGISIFSSKNCENKNIQVKANIISSTKNSLNSNAITNSNSISNEVNAIQETNQIINNESEEFNEKTMAEWESLVRDYYDANMNFVPEVIQFTIDQKSNLVIEIYKTYQDFQKEQMNNYIMVEKGTNKITNKDGEEIKLQLEEKAETINLKFNDSQFVAIGVTTAENEFELAQKYFLTESQYRKTKEVNAKISDEANYNKFMIIPKDNDVKISVYKCTINAEGKVSLNDEIIENHTGNLIVMTDQVQTKAQICLKIEYKGNTNNIPLQINSSNKKLDFSKFEKDVKDISIY